MSTCAGRLGAEGIAPSTAARYLGVFRQLLAFAVEDGRVMVNIAASVKAPTAGYAKREGQYAWVFDSPKGGPLGEPNWKRSGNWAAALKKIGRPTLRVHDLRHTCASLWLGAGADHKVVQRILGHAAAAMTMDLYGHLIDQNLWDSAKRCCVERMTRLELATSTLGRPWTPWRCRMRPFGAAWRGGPSGWLVRGLSTVAGAGEGHATRGEPPAR